MQKLLFVKNVGENVKGEKMSKKNVKEINEKVLQEKLENLEILYIELANDFQVLKQQFHSHGHLPSGKIFLVLE